MKTIKQAKTIFVLSLLLLTSLVFAYRDRFVDYLKIKDFEAEQKNITMRLEALENALTKLNSTIICESQIELMKKYNLTRLDCESITWYDSGLGLQLIG